MPKFASWADAVPYGSGWNMVSDTNSVFALTENYKSAWEMSGSGFQITTEKAWNGTLAGTGFATSTGSGWATVIPHSPWFATYVDGERWFSHLLIPNLMVHRFPVPEVQASSAWTEPRFYPESPLPLPQDLLNKPKQLQPFTNFRLPTLAFRTLQSSLPPAPDVIPAFPPTWPEVVHLKGGTASPPFRAHVEVESSSTQSMAYQAITSMPEYRAWSFEVKSLVSLYM
jgi:hypothetical protein